MSLTYSARTGRSCTVLRTVPARCGAEARAPQRPRSRRSPGVAGADAGRMYSFATAESWSSEGLWSWFVAGREARAALDAVEEAAGSLQQLSTDADWQSQGMRALHELLVELQRRAEALMAELHVRDWEITRAGAS
ncbi:hypothetical protein GCM10010489_00910 [Microbacterium saperdae]|nr:hypothetical protein GCM10010489_00910 [Microbacterium saperdae]